MAKQIGYTDTDLERLRAPEPSGHFEPSVRAALRYAQAMTEDPHRVTDEVFAELREHYDEGQIVELTCAIGLTSYFNRFTSALRVDLSGSNAPYESGPT